MQVGDRVARSTNQKMINRWGHERSLRTTRVPIVNEYDEVAAILGIVEDITTEIEYEAEKTQHTEKLKHAVEQAEKANEAKTEFLSRMSHEIRTPLSAVMGLIQVALDSDDMGLIKESLEKSESASKTLYAVINDMLDLSKIEADKMSIISSEFTVESMLEQTYDIVTGSAEEKGLHLVVEVGFDVPEDVVGDRNHLTQVLVNLLSNAIKFTPKGGLIRMGVRVSGIGENQVHIDFEVEDNGIGMSEELVDRLFQPFEQAEVQVDSPRMGTGLGLPIARKLVNLMGGEIEVSSEKGKGSVFRFTLPFERVDNGKNVLERYTHRFKGIELHKIGNNSSRASNYFMHYLKTLGATVYKDDNVGQSVEKLLRREEPVDVIILDLALTQENELEVMQKLHDIYDSDRVLLLTSGADAVTKRKIAKKIGVDQILSRPLFPSKIVKSIEAVLGASFKEAVKQTVPDFSHARLLVVDDVDVNREIVMHFLDKTQIKIDEAENGEVAVELYEKHGADYDLILMDVQMPVMDGYDATTAIRKREEETGVHVPIYAITASAYGSEIRKCLDVGMDAHIAKPFQKEQLMETIAYTLEHKLISFVQKKEHIDLMNDLKEQGWIDSEKGVDQAMGDLSFYYEMLDQFIDTSDDLLQDIQLGWESKNWEEMQNQLETLHEMTTKLSLGNLSELSANLANGEMDVDGISHLKRLHGKTIDAINQLRL